jgi:P27 family predicted phage terminase small subunit
MRGRRPKPTELKRLAGNPGKRPLNQDEPTFTANAMRCPRHLTDEAKKEWRRVTRELQSAGLLTNVDRAALAAYCQAWANWVEAMQALEKEDKVCVTDKGYAHPNPWVGIANKALEEMRRWMTEFGMTPSSRSRVKVEKPAEPDPFEEFVKQRLG